jgi:hypothetical protein
MAHFRKAAVVLAAAALVMLLVTAPHVEAGRGRYGCERSGRWYNIGSWFGKDEW